jgi:flagellar biosynthesis regulator FlbT
MKTQTKKKNFSRFTLKEALKQLQIEELIRWQIEFKPFKPSEFFQTRLQRLEKFDLTISEKAKELLVDAICEEVILQHPHLKIWKEAPLQSDKLTGFVDYLLAEKKAYLEAPLLCVVEAKKDKFDKGLAQCLLEMQACQWNNEQLNQKINVYGIVTNGEVWKFYQLNLEGQIYETLPHSLGEINNVLGILDYVFVKCEENLKPFPYQVSEK